MLDRLEVDAPTVKQDAVGTAAPHAPRLGALQAGGVSLEALAILPEEARRAARAAVGRDGDGTPDRLFLALALPARRQEPVVPVRQARRGGVARLARRVAPAAGRFAPEVPRVAVDEPARHHRHQAALKRDVVRDARARGDEAGLPDTRRLEADRPRRPCRRRPHRRRLRGGGLRRAPRHRRPEAPEAAGAARLQDRAQQRPDAPEQVRAARQRRVGFL